jgi:hypothetical protein
MTPRLLSICGRILAAAIALGAGAAWAGPPYAADDPEPTDTGHWEIYAFAAGTQGHGAFDGGAGFDLNYGPVANVQLTATLPLAIADDHGPTHVGAGDIEFGAKYRFFEDEADKVSVAIFPRVILPTASRRFGTGRVRLLLPVWAQKDFGPWSLFGGGGYMINPGAGNRDFWQSGLALTRQLTPRLSLGGEVSHEGPDAAGAHAVTSFGLGGIYRLGDHASLLFSGGPGIVHHGGGRQFNAYLALGLNF